MVLSMGTTNTLYLPHRINKAMRLNFNTIFYVQYRSEEISPLGSNLNQNDSRQDGWILDSNHEGYSDACIFSCIDLSILFKISMMFWNRTSWYVFESFKSNPFGTAVDAKDPTIPMSTAASLSTFSFMVARSCTHHHEILYVQTKNIIPSQLVIWFFPRKHWPQIVTGWFSRRLLATSEKSTCSQIRTAYKRIRWQRVVITVVKTQTSNLQGRVWGILAKDASLSHSHCPPLHPKSRGTWGWICHKGTLS